MPRRERRKATGTAHEPDATAQPELPDTVISKPAKVGVRELDRRMPRHTPDHALDPPSPRARSRHDTGVLHGFEQHDLAELRGRLIAITERWLDACLAAHTRELNAA
jgi:hypothetical protein